MYYIEPEVPGQLGDNTVLDTSVHPPIVHKLHFRFYGWLGDDLIECFPVFLVSEKLKDALLKSNLSGFEIAACEIEVDEQLRILQPGLTIPDFYWLKIPGDADDDFSFINSKLKVSEMALKFLSDFNIKNADIT